ncbi:hypothetical protein S7335_1106 [Synechococcus sp. PCC 7335]|nr:hypothetical protein S7335_1106 [Synechococcus sp. PCC 7335]
MQFLQDGFSPIKVGRISSWTWFMMVKILGQSYESSPLVRCDHAPAAQCQSFSTARSRRKFGQ